MATDDPGGSGAGLVGRLVAQVPGLRGLLEEHVSGRGSVEPSIFLAEVMRWTVSDFEEDGRGRGQNPGWRDVVSFLDQECALDEGGDTAAMIHRYFTANTPRLGSPGDQLNFLLGRHLKPDHDEFMAEYLSDPTAGTHPEAAELVDVVVRTVPRVTPLYEDNLDGKDCLTHPFFADLTRWVIDDFESCRGGTPGSNDWHKILSLLETTYARDPGNQAAELIHVSFVENLPYPWERGAAILDELGPHLLDALKAVQGAMEICRRIGKDCPGLLATYRALFGTPPPPDADPSEEFFAAATKWACQDYLASLSRTGSVPGWRELMDLFEHEYASDGFEDEYGTGEGHIAGLIEEAVLPELPLPGEPADGIREHLGPHLTEGLKLLPTIPPKQPDEG